MLTAGLARQSNRLRIKCGPQLIAALCSTSWRDCAAPPRHSQRSWKIYERWHSVQFFNPRGMPANLAELNLVYRSDPDWGYPAGQSWRITPPLPQARRDDVQEYGTQ